MTLHIQSKRVSDNLNVIRGLAAVAVLVFHVRYRFFFEYRDVTSPDPLALMFYVVTSFGHDAVMIFFVLSGYFISASVLRDQATGRWSWGNYAVSRGTRLYLVLLPGLLLTVFWDRLGLVFYPSHPIYSGADRPWSQDLFPVAERLTATTFLANGVFLQEVLAPSLGSNEPLWSLSYEFWYYVLFPLGWLALAHPRRVWRLTASFALVALLLTLLGKNIAQYFPIWLFGAVVCLLPQIPLLQRQHPWWVTLLAGALFCAVMSFTHTGPFREHVTSSVLGADYVTATAFAVLLHFLLHNLGPSRPDLYTQTAKGLAGFSYTLYVVHMPVLVFLRAALVPDAPWTPDGLHIAYGVGLALGCIGYAYLLAQLTEARTDKVRRRLLAWFGTRRWMERRDSGDRLHARDSGRAMEGDGL